MSHPAPTSAPTADTLASFAAEHGLNNSEYALLLKLLGRTPTLTEIGMTGAMWSEHCSYKSTRVWLRQLPTTAPWVICGPGENAGVIDIGDGQAAIFKMESHNHPSYIEPYQGAATGVGGIMRDVFTMGARPIANLNALRFGEPTHPRTREIVAGVVAGIGGYGNCVGVPTVGGETNFHASYNGNCLVNAMCVGLADANKIFYSTGAGLGQPVVYVGSKTGRDGIKGASMSSAEFDDSTASKRPTVQVGDPFIEKLLIEACLELMDTDCIISVQDMGAAGLTCSAVEIAAKAGLGIELNMDAVPQRERGMNAYEIMLSESQERMLMVLKPGTEATANAIFAKWGLDCATIGTMTNTGRIIIKQQGQVQADLPVAELVDQSPVYQRPYEIPAPLPVYAGPTALPAGTSLLAALQKLISSPDLCSRRWIWEQYDSLVGSHTAQGPGGDAAVVRVNAAGKALAMTTDCTPRYCAADPVMGAKQAVAEAYRNISAVGALPLAVTDNMNFGNPEKPQIMGQFAGAVLGLKEACLALNTPIVSGNCSLYNETKGSGIMPTPAIGAVGVLPNVAQAVGSGLPAAGLPLVLLGHHQTYLGQSLYLREVLGVADQAAGAPPVVDLAAELAAGQLVQAEIRAGHIIACHDVADGGLLVAITEMAMRGKCGAQLSHSSADPAFWYSESQGCYVVATNNLAALTAAATAAGVPALMLGTTGGEALTLADGQSISLASLHQQHEAWLPNFMQQAH